MYLNSQMKFYGKYLSLQSVIVSDNQKVVISFPETETLEL